MRTLDALALAKLKNLRFGLRRHRAEGHLSGRHRSVHYGFSQEFAHHRQYAPGDELKFLDWKVYARKDRYFVKQFQEDKALQTYLLVDASGSMGYRGAMAYSAMAPRERKYTFSRGAGLGSKWQHACGLAMAMAYLVMRQDDAAGLVTFDTQSRVFLPPRRPLTHLELMDAALADAKPGGETDLGGVLRSVTGLISRRSLIVLISDLLGEATAILAVLKALRARKHEVLVLQVLDPTERDLSFEGPIRFESLESEDVLRCEVDLVRQAYHEEFERQQKLYHSGFHQAAIPYGVFYTHVPWDVTLSGFLALCSRF